MSARRKLFERTDEWFARRSCDSFRDHDAMALGMALWERSYKITRDPLERERLIEERIASARKYAAEATAHDLVLLSAYFCTQWAQEAFPVLTAYEKFAAALMATTATQEAVGGVLV